MRRSLSSSSRNVSWVFNTSLTVHFNQLFLSLIEPWNHNSVAKTVFLAWLLREVCSFRDSENYGQFTQKTSEAMRQSKALPPSSASRRSSRLTSILNLIMNLLFFGIPHTYYAHVKVFVSLFLVVKDHHAGSIAVK
jgi:hypothetical protein